MDLSSVEISFNTTRTSQRFTVKWGIKDNLEGTSVVYIARSGFTYNLCHVACRQLKTQAACCCSLTSTVKACFHTSPIFPDVNLWEGACSRSQQNPRAALVWSAQSFAVASAIEYLQSHPRRAAWTVSSPDARSALQIRPQDRLFWGAVRF